MNHKFKKFYIRIIILLSGMIFILFANAHIVSAAEKITHVVLVQPFENLGDKENSWLSSGISDSITNDLVFIRNLQVITDNDRRSAIQQIELSQAGLHGDTELKAVGALLGADLILTGSYKLSGNNLRITAKLIEIPAGSIKSIVTLDGKRKEIFSLQDQIIEKLFAQKLTKKTRKYISTKPTNDIKAYKLYSSGLEARHKNPRLAYAYYIKAISRDANYINALIQASQSAVISMSLFSEGMEYIKRAYTITEKVYGNSNVKYAQVLIAMANVYYKKRQFRTSLKYNLKAAKVLETADREDHIFYKNSLHNCALAYTDLRKYRMAMDYYKKAVDFYHKNNARRNYSYINMIINIGVLHKNMNNFHRALDMYAKAKDYAEKLKLRDTKLYGGILANIAVVQKNLKQYDKALSNYHAALKILEKLYLLETSEHAGTLFNIGNIYYERGDRATATKYYKKSYVIFKKLGLHKIANRVRKMY